jgi:hypothetical protein
MADITPDEIDAVIGFAEEVSPPIHRKISYR